MTNTSELPADLSQNLDEALDVQLGLGALAGLRNGAAFEDRRQSIKRYEDRNHRLHEARMKRLGLEGDEPPEEDVNQQVLIRSPINHHYHYSEPKPAATDAPVPQPQPSPPPPEQSNWLHRLGLPAVIAATGIGSAASAYFLTRPAPVSPPGVIQPGDEVDVRLQLPEPSKP